MKFSIEKEALLTCLTTVSPAVSGGSTLPVLKYIYLEAEDGRVIVRATNLELYLDAWCEAEVKKPGACCVDAMLRQLLPSFSDGVIFFERQKTLKITQDKSLYRLPIIIDADEFPVFPDIQDYSTVTSLQPLCEALRRSGIAVSADNARPSLQTYRIDTEDSVVAGADGYRLSMMKNIVLPGTATSIPNQSLKTILTLLKSVTGEVELSVGDWLAVKAENWQVAVNSSAEEYPNFKAPLHNITANVPNTTVKISCDALIRKLKVAAMFSKRAYDDSRPYEMRVLIDKEQGITLSMEITDVVAFEEPLACEVEGENVEVCLSPAMLLEAVSVVKASDVVLEFRGDSTAFFVYDPDNEDWTYMQMPMVKYSEEKTEQEDDF